MIKGLAGLGAGRGDVNDFDTEGADRSGEDLYDVGVVEGSDVGNDVRSQGWISNRGCDVGGYDTDTPIG